MNSMKITITFLTILSCNVRAADYLPFKEGNQWTYTMSNGMEMVSKFAGFANVGTVRCGIIETTMSGQTSREYLAADAEGLKSYMAQSLGQEFRYNPPLVRIKLPYKEGDSWSATVNQFGTSLTTNFESAGTERIQTPVVSLTVSKYVRVWIQCQASRQLFQLFIMQMVLGLYVR